MAGRLEGKRIAFFASPEGTEQVELTVPWERLTEAGAELELVSFRPGEIQMFNHLDKGDTWPVDETVPEATVDDYDGLVLPGGVANPDMARTVPEAVAFVRSFFDRGKPVAAICHAPWMLVEADVVRDRTVTSWPSLRTDIRNAGGRWVDEQVVTEPGLVTSRKPDDLEAFSNAAIDMFSGAGASRSAA
ncbi:MAG: type 1 glutamine amidotransferase domain-containing protein [Actinomycetota bacterium]|jgi:protease I